MRIKQNAADWRTIYTAYLASKEWATQRRLVLQRAASTCEACLSAPAREVHHTVYPQPLTLATLRAQPLWQLRAVCTRCHEQLHRGRA